MTRFACRTKHSVHTKVHVRHHVTQQDHRHELAGVGQRCLRGSEEKQNRIKEGQTDNHKQESDNQVQGYRISQKVLCCLIVLLSQFHTNTSRRTDTHRCTKGSTQVHKGERDTQTRDGFRTNDLSDHGTVDNVIETSSRHSHNCRKGILPKQSPHWFLSQL